MVERKSEADATLTLLRLLESHPEFTQRELSNAMGVSVGKAHYLLKALVAKGMVKAQNFRRSSRKMGYLYLLTPEGVRQRWKLTQAFLISKEQEYAQLQMQIASLREEVGRRSSKHVRPTRAA